MKLEQASIYSLPAIRKAKKRLLDVQHRDARLNAARDILNLPDATLNGVYIHILREMGWKSRKTNKAKHTAIKRWLNSKKVANGFYESDRWRKLRYEALKKYGRKCSCCGGSPETGSVLHVDHIKPRSKHPELELDINNLQILCRDCNLGKSNYDEIDYR